MPWMKAFSWSVLLGALAFSAAVGACGSEEASSDEPTLKAGRGGGGQGGRQAGGSAGSSGQSDGDAGQGGAGASGMAGHLPAR